MNIALIGPSGAGKGTQVETLTIRFQLQHVSTGDLFRNHLENQTALGLLARRYMTQGELVPDEVVDAMVEEWRRKLPARGGALFDGFPRTTAQAKFLDDLFAERGQSLDALIYLHVTDEEIVRRVAGRLICHHCLTPFNESFRPFRDCPTRQCQGEHLFRRTDDTPEMIQLRLKVFHRVTQPLLQLYQQRSRLLLIDGQQPFDEVAAAMTRALEAVQRGTPRWASPSELAEVLGRRLAPAASHRRTLDLVLLGAPGSGKGTQAECLRKEFHLQHIATGDLFRENLKKATNLGLLAKAYMERGAVVPDDVTDAMVHERLSRPDTSHGFILDGYPRTLHQAEALTEMLADLHRQLYGVLYINVPDDEIVNRLSGRRICRQCQAPYHIEFNPPGRPNTCDLCGGELYQRMDDAPATIQARLRTFHTQTEPLIQKYRAAGLLIEIDGHRPVAEVSKLGVAAVQKAASQELQRRDSVNEAPPQTD